MSDGLDKLSNKDLLAKCREYGLPAIPVTDSTRSVITRRLRAAMLGVPLNKGKSANSAASKKTIPRRETLHGEKVGRSNFNNNNNKSNSENLSRRTLAYGLDNVSLSGRSVQTTTTVSDIGSQSEDDDYYMVQVPDVRYSNKTQSPTSRDDARLRRSVSLTKSGVLTTSYTREVDAPRYEETEEIDEPQTYTYERPQMPTVPVRSLPSSYEPSFSRTFATDLIVPKPHLTQTQLNSTSYLDDEYNQYPSPTTFNSSPRIFHLPPTSSLSPRNTSSGSDRTFAKDSSSSARQRQTIGGSSWPAGRLIHPTAKVDTLYPKLDKFFENPPRPEGQRHDSTDSELEADEPQLSRSSRFSPQARPQVRRPLVRQNPQSVPMEHFRELIRTLDSQYHLRYYLILTVVVMIATMVYVLMTPS